MNSFKNFGSFKLEAEETRADAVPSPWNNVFRYITETKRFPDYRRGILRQTQLYDPFVNTALKQFDPELHSAIKGKTRAPGDEWDIYDRLTRYDASELSFPQNERFRLCYKTALEQVMSEFKLRDPVVPHWIMDVDLVKNTSSGFPHFQRKGDILDTLKQEGRSHFHLLKRLPLWRTPLLPCVPATRGGLADITSPKTRLVWMYPGTMTAIEAVFAQPLIYHLFREKEEHLICGVDTKFRIQRFLSLLSPDEGKLGVGLDFKSFDTLRCNWVIRDAFDVLKQNIYFNGYYDDTNGLQTFGDSKAERLRHAWDNIVEYFIHTPMLLPNGRCVSKHIGVPSGSHFTNLIDSIVNRILIRTFSLYCGIPISGLKTNGDDSAFYVSETYVKDIILIASSFFKEFFGMTINIDKSCIAGLPSEMHVSGTVWLGLKPTRTTEEWMMLAAYGETYSRIPFDSFQRLLGLGLAGGFGNTTFTRFFDYFQSGYDCRHGPNLLNWKKLRFLQNVFGIEDLPLVYKQGARTNLRLRLLVT